MNIVLGPPGTGKTTHLLNLTDQHLADGMEPGRIGYFSFTRKAALEAADRAFLRFGYSPKDMPYFRTLHSLAFRELGTRKSDRMDKKDYEELGKELKVPFFLDNDVHWFNSSNPFPGFGYGDQFLEIITIARITGRPLMKVYAGSTLRFTTDWSIVERVAKALEHYKRDTGKFDYTDLIERAVNLEAAPRLDALFIDEAQDLSALQWQYVRILAKKAKKVYIAGDDDQAIYGWAGADITQFIGLEGEVTVLGQSHRIPGIHHRLSQKIVSRIQSRRPKEFLPRQEEGGLFWHTHPDTVDLSEGEWLLLGRTRNQLKIIEDGVRKRGVFYTREGRYDLSEHIAAVQTWEWLRKGESVLLEDVVPVYRRLPKIGALKYGFKSRLEEANLETPGLRVTMNDLRESFGLTCDLPWEQAMEKIPNEDKDYIARCLRKGQDLHAKPRIKISTIHSAKGGEAENVVLMTDDTKNPNSKYREEANNRDYEHRVWYVGLTRAKKNLHLIHHTKRGGYNLPYVE